MRYLITTIILIALAATGFSQKPVQGLGSPGNIVRVNGELEVDTLFFPSQRDTTFTPRKAGALIYKVSDKHMYIYNGIFWQRLLLTGEGGQGAAGSAGSVQYKSATTGLFQGDLHFVWDSANNRLNIGNYSSSSNGELVIGGSSTGEGFVHGGGGPFRISGGGTGMFIESTGNAPIVFRPRQNTTFSIDSLGVFRLGAGLAPGTSGQVLASAGTGAPPSWVSNGVTSVGITNGFGLNTPTGSPVTTTGNIGLSVDTTLTGLYSRYGIDTAKANIRAAGSPTAWVKGGNTLGKIDTIGSKDNFAMAVNVNNIERARFQTDGTFTIGQTATNATDILQVNGGIKINSPTFTSTTGRLSYIGNNQLRLAGGFSENITLGQAGGNVIGLNANTVQLSGVLLGSTVQGIQVTGATNGTSLLINSNGGLATTTAGVKQVMVSVAPSITPTVTTKAWGYVMLINPTINTGVGLANYVLYGGGMYEPIETNLAGIGTHVAWGNSIGDNWFNKKSGGFLVGDSIVKSSIKFEVRTTSQGSIPFPIMTSAQRAALSPLFAGEGVYQSDGVAGYYYYDGANWIRIGSENRSFIQGGNAFGAVGVLGTTDNNSLSIITNNTAKLIIGTTIPDGASTDSILVINASNLKKVPSNQATKFTVNTTDATVTTISTIAIPTGKVIEVEYTISGKDASNNVAIYRRLLRAQNVAGTVTILGSSAQGVGTDNIAVAFTTAAISESVSGTNVLIRVAGVAATNITWEDVQGSPRQFF